MTHFQKESPVKRKQLNRFNKERKARDTHLTRLSSLQLSQLFPLRQQSSLAWYHLLASSNVEPKEHSNLNSLNSSTRKETAESSPSGEVLFRDFSDDSEFQPCSTTTKFDLSSFEVIQTIGKGSYGKVVLVRCLSDKTLVALKVV